MGFSTVFAHVRTARAPYLGLTDVMVRNTAVLFVCSWCLNKRNPHVTKTCVTLFGLTSEGGVFRGGSARLSMFERFSLHERCFHLLDSCCAWLSPLRNLKSPALPVTQCP